MIMPDKTIQKGYTTEGHRDFLRTMNKWYKEGIVDKEFMTTDWALLKEKWNNGRAGYAGGATWYRLYKGTELYDGLMAVDPKAEIVLAPPIKGPEGYYGYMLGGRSTSGGLCFGIQLEKDQAKLIKAIQMLEKIMSDFNLCTMVHWGQEGVHWQKNPELGSPDWIEPYIDPQKRGPIGTGFFWGQPGTWENMKRYQRSDYDELTKYAAMTNLKNEEAYTHLITTSADISKIEGDLVPIMRQWMIRFITGDADIETGWNEYLADLKARGQDKVDAAMNESYRNAAKALAEMDRLLGM
jgi:putative aldouronate transport system substrate-binding protein